MIWPIAAGKIKGGPFGDAVSVGFIVSFGFVSGAGNLAGSKIGKLCVKNVAASGGTPESGICNSGAASFDEALLIDESGIGGPLESNGMVIA